MSIESQQSLQKNVSKEKYHIKNYGSITVALKHPTRTAGGLHWKEI